MNTPLIAASEDMIQLCYAMIAHEQRCRNLQQLAGAGVDVGVACVEKESGLCR